MRFGQAVQVEYVDLGDSTSQLKFADLLATVEEGNIPYPVVAINGQLKLAGSAHYYNVLPHVEEILQAEESVPSAQ
jgi:hypothetical protein